MSPVSIILVVLSIVIVFILFRMHIKNALVNVFLEVAGYDHGVRGVRRRVENAIKLCEEAKVEVNTELFEMEIADVNDIRKTARIIARIPGKDEEKVYQELLQKNTCCCVCGTKTDFGSYVPTSANPYTLESFLKNPPRHLSGHKTLSESCFENVSRTRFCSCECIASYLLWLLYVPTNRKESFFLPMRKVLWKIKAKLARSGFRS